MLASDYLYAPYSIKSNKLRNEASEMKTTRYKCHKFDGLFCIESTVIRKDHSQLFESQYFLKQKKFKSNITIQAKGIHTLNIK